MTIKQKSLSSLFKLLLLSNLFTYAQTEIFSTKYNFSENYLNDFYSSVRVDDNRVCFIANDFYTYTFDKNSKQLLWTSYAAYKTNNCPIVHKEQYIEQRNGGKLRLLNTQTGDTIQTLKIEELRTQPYFKENMIYCTAISSEIGGAIQAYDLKKNEIVWQKFIGHGVSFQPYFLKDKIVVNYENQYWFELDYNGNALDKSQKCYSKNTEPPFEEQFCNIHYDVVNQYHKDLTTKNVTIDETKYYYGTNETVVLKRNELKIINQKNKVLKEIDLDNIITLPETAENDYSEILKVEDNTVWFVYENILGVYDFKNNKTVKAFDLSTWNPHKIVLDGKIIWLISRNDGNLIALALPLDPEEEGLKREKAQRYEQTHQCGNEVEAMNEARKKALERLKK